MKKGIYILLSILVSFLFSCNKIDNEPTGNARLSIKGVEFHEVMAAEKLTGTVVTTTYTQTDSSSTLLIDKSTNTFNINAPIDFNQYYDYNLPAGIKKITFEISFKVIGATAEKVTIEEVNFTHNGASKYSTTDATIFPTGDSYKLPIIEINY